MNLGKKILAAAMLALPLSQAACGGTPPAPVTKFGEAFVDALISNLQDERAHTRYRAVHALAECRGAAAKKVIPAIRCMLLDKDPVVAEEAARALRKLEAFAGELVLAVHQIGSAQ